ncbi:hypothetical protein LWI29_006146 [Acer saccharum]|uniref:Mediator complex subunit 15 KIX domain-containing protein n=1 Tax=Acer saccharum TaxID=4024 RepID=A0AA39VWY6_ACESA|nr:hypothetical protein LWI29_006146 [Acer saccharum]
MADLHRTIEIFQSDSGGTPFSSGGDMHISDLHDTMKMRRTKREQTSATSTIVDSIINNPTVVDNSTVGESSIDLEDWRNHLLPGSRQRIVNKITDASKWHLRFSGPQGFSELLDNVEMFEEKTYTVASSQSDYLRKISDMCLLATPSLLAKPCMHMWNCDVSRITCKTCMEMLAVRWTEFTIS